MNVEELNHKEVREILKKIGEQWDIDLSRFKFLEKEFRWYISKKEKKIYIVKKELAELLKTNLPIERFGLYIARLEKDGIRLSIEGSQLFGPFARKKVIEFDAKKLLTGNFPETKEPGYHIVKDGKYYIGCVKRTKDRTMDYIPKNRKIMYP